MVLRFFVHVVTGTVVFLLIYSPAVGLSFYVRWLKSIGVDEGLIAIIEFVEYCLVVCDSFLFLVFFVNATWSAARYEITVMPPSLDTSLAIRVAARLRHWAKYLLRTVWQATLLYFEYIVTLYTFLKRRVNLGYLRTRLGLGLALLLMFTLLLAWASGGLNERFVVAAAVFSSVLVLVSPAMAYALGTGPSRTPARLQLGFARSFPFSVIATIPLFLLVCYWHDRLCDAFYSPLLRASDVLAEEYRREAGNLVLFGSGPDAKWTTSYRNVLEDDRHLLETVFIARSLDEGDFSYLRSLFREGDSTSNEVELALRCLKSDPMSEDDARRAIREVAELMERLRGRLRAENRQDRRPILFRFEPAFVAEMRDKATQQTKVLAENIEEFKRVSGYVSATRPITCDLHARPDQRDRLIRLCEGNCRISRVAFTLIHIAWDGSDGDRSLRQDFVRLQKVAEETTRALAQHDSLRGAEYSTVREALHQYAQSMNRRIAVIEGAQGGGASAPNQPARAPPP